VSLVAVSATPIVWPHDGPQAPIDERHCRPARSAESHGRHAHRASRVGVCGAEANPLAYSGALGGYVACIGLEQHGLTGRNGAHIEWRRSASEQVSTRVTRF
jgi:hypothetical protein